MKVLLLSQGRKIEDQPDFDAALRSATCLGEPVEVRNIPFVGYVEQHGGRAFYDEVLRVNGEFQPDLVFFQFFHSANPGDPRPCVKALRAAANHPLIFGSIGDPFDSGLKKWLGRRLPKQTWQLASVADAFFSTAMGTTADELVAHGARRVVFLPHAFCVAHFGMPDPRLDPEKRYEITALGSYASPINKRPWIGISRGWMRCRFVRLMHAHFGTRFALFGRGWRKDIGSGAIVYKDQVDLFRQSRVNVDIPAQISNVYYMSDRPFFIAGSGSPLVMYKTPRIDKVFRADEQAFFADRIEDIPAVCERILKLSPEQLAKCRDSVLEAVCSRHLISNRMDTLLSVYEAIRLGKGVGHLRLWHFLPEVDLEDERQYAIRNWQ